MRCRNKNQIQAFVLINVDVGKVWSYVSENKQLLCSAVQINSWTGRLNLSEGYN
jgi:hypothetical protein